MTRVFDIAEEARLMGEHMARHIVATSPPWHCSKAVILRSYMRHRARLYDEAREAKVPEIKRHYQFQAWVAHEAIVFLRDYPFLYDEQLQG